VAETLCSIYPTDGITRSRQHNGKRASARRYHLHVAKPGRPKSAPEFIFLFFKSHNRIERLVWRSYSNVAWVMVPRRSKWTPVLILRWLHVGYWVDTEIFGKWNQIQWPHNCSNGCSSRVSSNLHESPKQFVVKKNTSRSGVLGNVQDREFYKVHCFPTRLNIGSLSCSFLLFLLLQPLDILTRTLWSFFFSFSPKQVLFL